MSMDITQEEIDEVKNLPDKEFIQKLKRQYEENKKKVNEEKVSPQVKKQDSPIDFQFKKLNDLKESINKNSDEKEN